MVSGRCCYDRCACAGFKAGGADPYVCAACGHHEMLHALDGTSHFLCLALLW